VGAWRQRAIILFTQELEKLLLILTNELCNLRVTSGNLLKDRFQHLRLLLDQLAELLKVRVIPQEVEVGQSFPSSGSTRTSSTTCALSSTGLSSGFKQIDRLITTGRRGSRGSTLSGRSGRGRGCGGCGGCGSLLLLLLLDVVRDSL
jgi:hypothetical protein